MLLVGFVVDTSGCDDSDGVNDNANDGANDGVVVGSYVRGHELPDNVYRTCRQLSEHCRTISL